MIIRSVALIFFVLMIFSFCADGVFSENTSNEQQLILENDHWRVIVDPLWGGRASSMISKSDGYDFVSLWGDVRPRASIVERRGQIEGRLGGIFRSTLSGSHLSSQPDESYAVLSSSVEEAVLSYKKPYPLMDGLREERRIYLEGKDVVLDVRVINEAEKDRVMYYRIKDFPGVGERLGRDSVYIIPREKDAPFAFAPVIGEIYLHHFFSHPEESWYALADLDNNRGLLVQSSSPLECIYFWGSRTDYTSRTGELFFPRVKLAPGEFWETEIRYRAFAPGQPDTGSSRLDSLLLESSIEKQLEGSAERELISSGLPFSAEMSFDFGRNPVTVVPIHPASTYLGGNTAPDYGKNLEKIHLHGTPGEVVSFAFAVTANSEIEKGEVVFSELSSVWRRRIGRDAFEPNYVAGESLILVNSWDLAQNVPYEYISQINNNIEDAEAITPFSLKEGEIAFIWTNLRIPDNAPAGKYLGACSLAIDGDAGFEFKISLNVRPFKLIPADHKTYGTFFEYHIKAGEGEPTAFSYREENAITREEFLEVMKVFRDIGSNGFVFYVVSRDDLLWVMDRFVDLEMKGAVVLIDSSRVRPEDIEERNITAFGWGVDEPSTYDRVAEVVRAYENRLGRGFVPSFTPNYPLGLIMAEHLEKIIPIISPNGNAPYVITETRRFSDEGRNVYWYECDGLGEHGAGRNPVSKRALRGIYLWKEPVDGIFDWDSGSTRPKLTHHHMAGFAGTKVLPRLGLENIRQGLTDLKYLHTLETLAERTQNASLKAEAEDLMQWIRDYVAIDFQADGYYNWNVAPHVKDIQYLDDLRQEVADMIERLVRAH